MKKLLISILAMLFCIAAIGQFVSSRNQSPKYDYRNKSSGPWLGLTKKTLAWSSLTMGATLAIGGVIILINDKNSEYPSPEIKNFAIVMCVLGGAGIAASIPLFIASARDKRKANDMTLNLGFEKSLVFQQRKIQNNYYPALSLKIRIE